jgi:hypothetical protein
MLTAFMTVCFTLGLTLLAGMILVAGIIIWLERKDKR